MAQEFVNLPVSFNALLKAIEQLNVKEKLQLWEALEGQLAQAEEQVLEQDPVVLAEIREARAAYLEGDFIELDDYIAEQKKE